MDPAVAALIGAGVASLVSIGSQFIGHELSISRDRRNQERQRVTEAIVEAGSLLYRKERAADYPTLEQWEKTLDPESVAAQDPELHWQLGPMHESISRGITLLKIHLGHEHPLIDEYIEVAGTIGAAETSWITSRRKGEQERIRAIPELARELRESQLARDRWMKHARAEIQAI